MRKLLFCLALLVLVQLACTTGSANSTIEPTPIHYDGVWVGTTSQGYEMSLGVEKNTVTSITMVITMYGNGWNATQRTEEPIMTDIEIEEDGFFTYEWNSILMFGTFVGDTVSGRIVGTHIHPQGLGAAAADVTFTAERVDSEGGNG